MLQQILGVINEISVLIIAKFVYFVHNLICFSLLL